MLLLASVVMAQTHEATTAGRATAVVASRADVTVYRMEDVKRILPTETLPTHEKAAEVVQKDRLSRPPVDPRPAGKPFPNLEVETVLDRGGATFTMDSGYERGAYAVYGQKHVIVSPDKPYQEPQVLWRWEVPAEYRKQGGFSSSGDLEAFLNFEPRHAYILGAPHQDPILLVFALERGLLWQQKVHFSASDDSEDLHLNNFYATMSGGLILAFRHEPKDSTRIWYSEIWVYDSKGRRTNRYRFPEVEGLSLKRAGKGEAFLLNGRYRVDSEDPAVSRAGTVHTSKDVAFLLDASGQLQGTFADAKGVLVNVMYLRDTAYAGLDYREKPKRPEAEQNVLYRLF